MDFNKNECIQRAFTFFYIIIAYFQGDLEPSESR